MKTIDLNFFPGWVRKSITFTIDDGNIPLDKKFMDIVKPYGICGTFNLSTLKFDKYTPEFYREFYRGYGISNHCKLHPFPMTEERRKPVSNEKFNPETIKSIAIENLLIENDESPIPIEEIYQNIATTRNISLSELQKEVEKTYKKIFQ